MLRLDWWRATAYQVTDDGMIAPAPGADIVPVDPWAQFRSDDWQTVNESLPHLTLANLCPRIEWTLRPGRDKTPDAAPLFDGWSIDRGTRTVFFDGDVRKPWTGVRSALLRRHPELREADIPTDGRIMLDESSTLDLWRLANVDREALLKWVSKHGLPGSLLHRYVSVTVGEGEERRSYARTIKGWVPVAGHLAPLHDSAVRFNALGHLEIVGLDEWQQRVPVSEAGGWPPSPGSPEFFRVYREPVAEVIEIAATLRAIIETLLTRPGDLAPFSPDERITSMAEMSTAKWLAQRTYLDSALSMGVQLTTAPTDRGLHQQLRCSSLLGALAMMVVAEASRRAGGWVIRCEYCGQLARRSAPAKFCSNDHRGAANVRKFKARR